MDPKQRDGRVKHGITCAYKAATSGSTQLIFTELIDRCGWQGLFGYNQLSELMLYMKGNSIAEGDILVLCIRLASELFQGKYVLPKPKHPTKLLALHEAGLFRDAQSLLRTLPKGHRDAGFDAKISVKCRPFIEAISQHMAYEAALEDPTTRPELLELYEIQSVKSDMAWYVENLGLKSQDILDLEDAAVRKVSPLLDQILKDNDMASMVTAPIASQKSMDKFIAGLPVTGPLEAGCSRDREDEMIFHFGEDGLILANL